MLTSVMPHALYSIRYKKTIKICIWYAPVRGTLAVALETA
jgi:hypothetical protein